MNDYVAVCMAVMGVFAALNLIFALLVTVMGGTGRKRSDVPIAILVAARNEEVNLPACLAALSRLDYPRELLEIHIGDDGSEDRTAEIIKDFIADKPWMHYHRIESKVGALKGKQNVLAQLARKSGGEFMLVTDADIRVHPLWAQSMVGAFGPKTGMVCGTTLVRGRTLFAHVQTLDWLMGMTLARAHKILGIPLTGIGNNMAVRRAAYEQIGGYEALPFSIVEDYQLFKYMVERGEWQLEQLMEEEAGAVSEPIPTLAELLRQRKRWFVGGRSIALHNKLLMFFNALILPVIAVAAFVLPSYWVLLMIAVKVSADFVVLMAGAFRMQAIPALVWFPLYELYYTLALIVTPILMWLPGGVVWKGRNY